MDTTGYGVKVGRDPLLHRVLEDVARIQGEAERFRAGLVLSKDELFEQLERDGRRLVCYFSGGGAIDQSDAAPLGSMLDSIGMCAKLDMLLNSAGGYGEAVEKLVHICRSHCTGEFRVIVPNWAKSAATLMTLGADTIVMGYPSELGPIDPQYEVSIANVVQQLSGHTFIHAFETAQKQATEAMVRGESPIAHLTALQASTMEPAFIEHCRRGIAFSRDIAIRYLRDHQLPTKAAARGETLSEPDAAKLAEEAAENLLSENLRFSHGRLIGPAEARDEVGLNVLLLESEDPLWKAYWELYVRAEVYMQMLAPAGSVSKLFVDRDSTLPAFS